MQTKKVPERKCLGCSQSFPKSTLIRVVKAPDGTVSLDFVGKKSGRGAYVCRKLSCFKKARKAKRFERSLDCEIPEEIYTRMEEEIAESEKGVKADGADK
ncbi:MAG: YlxR family protein [Ruminococcaceae bacterium]|nr:YlxR family protein [Oscillospiraceae bacterium]